MRSRTPPPHRVHMKARRCTMALYLGLDCSTQGLKAVVIDSERRILLQEAVNFDKVHRNGCTHYMAHARRHSRDRNTAPAAP